MATIIGTAVLEIATDTDLMGQDFAELEKDLKVAGGKAGESFGDAIEREARESLSRLEQEARSSTRSVADSVEDAGGRVKRSNEELGESFEKTREGFDRVDTGAMGFRDTLTGVQDGMAGASALAKGDLFNGLFLLGMGVGDLASGMVNFLVPAIKAAVVRFGVMKLALIGLGVAAAATAIGVLAFSLLDSGDKAEDTGDKVIQLQRDIKTLVETGSIVGDLKRSFDIGQVGVENFQRAVRVLQVDFNDMTKADQEFLLSLDDIQGTIDSSRGNFAALDTALADYVDQGGNATAVTQALNQAYGAQNVQTALANDLLPEFSKSILDASDEQSALGESTNAATVEQERQLAAMQRFSDMLKAQTDPVFAFVNAQGRLKQAHADVTKALEENGKESEQYRDAVNRLAEAELRSIDASAAMAGASEETVLPVLRQLKSDGQLSESSFKALEKAFKDAKKQADKLDGTRIKIYRDEYRRIFEEQFSGGNSGASFSTFHEGGIVPGHRGDEILALLEAGELVVPAGKWSDRQSGNSNAITFGPGSIVISVSGDDPHRAREAGGMAADEFLRRLGQAVAVA